MLEPVRKSLLPLVAVALAGASQLAPTSAVQELTRGQTDAAPTAAQAASSAPSVSPNALDERIDAILDDPRLDGAQAAVVVREADTGTILYSRNGHRRLLPASNTKLMTSVAAAEVLGMDYRFTTSVLTTGERSGSVLHGDLYLKGRGDPTMLASDYDRLARRVAEAGIRTIQGDLVADDSWFDRVRLGRDWAWSDEPYYYAAQISALTVAPNTDYDAGTVIVDVRPGRAPGDPPRVTVTPQTDYVRIVNRATTGGADSDAQISVHRRHGTNRIVVSGSIPVDGERERQWSSVWEPTGYAADVFRRALREHGVRVRGDTQFRPTPSRADELATHASMPLSRLFVPFLKLSNNGHAEVLIKTLGREARGEGSWPAGLAVAEKTLDELTVNTDAMRMVDGSGLSRQDLIAPYEFTTLLIAAQGQPWFDAWYTALPIAGRSERLVGGTLRDRMVGTAAAGNVHAKTGTLTSVTGLSGYVTDAKGRELVFSILLNNYLGDSPKDIEDEIAVTLAKHGDKATTSQARVRIPAPRLTRDDPSTPVDESSLECSWVKDCAG